MTRAQMFEDEKRRIIDSCFGKRDEDGSCKIFWRPRDGLRGATANLLLYSAGVVHHTH
jgi:hypothetical protein